MRESTHSLLKTQVGEHAFRDDEQSNSHNKKLNKEQLVDDPQAQNPKGDKWINWLRSVTGRGG